MQVLTPTGYVDPATLADGAELCAFDATTGAPIVNTVENIDFVDYAEWCRWWQLEDTVPEFTWYRINGGTLLFREQSIWRNGTNVCHVRDLVIGDVIYDDHDHDVTITSIDAVEDRTINWYRFDVSGDHSYIVDGITVHNASRFWVGGTGTWDSSTTTHWASTTGGTGGQSVPGSADTATLDGSSGGGTVTMNFGGTVTIQSLTMGAFTGTWDNSVNNNNFTLSTAFTGSGTATRTFKMGSATYNLTGTAGAVFNFNLVTGLTLTAGSETWAIGGVAQGGRSLITPSAAASFGNLTINSGAGLVQLNNQGATTFAAITINSGVTLYSNTGTVNATSLTVTGTAASPCLIEGGTQGTQSTFSVTSGTQTLKWAGIRDVVFTGGATFVGSDCFDLGHNSGITITPPAGLAPAPMVVRAGAPY